MNLLGICDDQVLNTNGVEYQNSKLHHIGEGTMLPVKSHKVPACLIIAISNEKGN